MTASKQRNTRRSPKAKADASLQLEITADALRARAGTEIQDWARQRLRALADVIEGHDFAGAGRLAGVSGSLVRHWVGIARRLGWQALLRRRQPRGGSLSATQVMALQKKLRTQLQKCWNRAERLRLAVALQILDKADPAIVARHHALNPVTVNHWMARLRRDGVAALLSKRPARPPLVQADPISLRAHAAQEPDRRVRHAIEALASLAEGRPVSAVAVSANAAEETVRRWVASFHAGGIEGLRLACAARAPQTSRLSPQQKKELAGVIKKKPSISKRELWDLVRTRYGADYSIAGLARLARRELGFAPTRQRRPVGA